jgi:hypothetical protein
MSKGFWTVMQEMAPSAPGGELMDFVSTKTAVLAAWRAAGGAGADQYAIDQLTEYAPDSFPFSVSEADDGTLVFTPRPIAA